MKRNELSERNCWTVHQKRNDMMSSVLLTPPKVKENFYIFLYHTKLNYLESPKVQITVGSAVFSCLAENYRLSMHLTQWHDPIASVWWWCGLFASRNDCHCPFFKTLLSILRCNSSRLIKPELVKIIMIGMTIALCYLEIQ